MKQKFNVITSTCVPLPLENVDTDQIIPARFLKATTREEKFFGDNLFRDWRYKPDGTVVEDEILNHASIGTIAPVTEQVIAKELFLFSRCLEETGRDYLVGIHVL